MYCFQMSIKMVHWNDRKIFYESESFCEINSCKKRINNLRMSCYCNFSNIFRTKIVFFESDIKKGRQGLHVRACSEFWHNSTPLLQDEVLIIAIQRKNFFL